MAGPGPGPVVRTARLVLRPFDDVDREPFFALNSHPLVVESLGSSPTRAENDANVDFINEEMDREGWGVWAIEVVGGTTFAGAAGLHRVTAPLPFVPAVEVEWRFHPDHWGHGYATEAAAASLRFGFEEAGLPEIVAFTTTLNTRSQAVMERIGMRRDEAGDFDHPSLPEGSPLRRHVLYRATAPARAAVEKSQDSPTVAP
jgi:RimJ/RimL family protein N-acetyltransferase